MIIAQLGNPLINWTYFYYRFRFNASIFTFLKETRICRYNVEIVDTMILNARCLFVVRNKCMCAYVCVCVNICISMVGGEIR